MHFNNRGDYHSGDGSGGGNGSGDGSGDGSGSGGGGGRGFGNGLGSGQGILMTGFSRSNERGRGGGVGVVNRNGNPLCNGYHYGRDSDALIQSLHIQHKLRWENQTHCGLFVYGPTASGDVTCMNCLVAESAL